MVDEVENILREIEDRVRAEQAMSLTSPPNSEPAVDAGVAVTPTADSSLKASLARIDSYLTTTERAWDRLPPVVSNRSGSVARLELWIKNLFKRTTRWYAWEQVNFNAAVNHGLRATLSAFSALEMELQSARHQLALQNEFLSKRTEQVESELNLRRAEIDAQRKLLEHEIGIREKEFHDKQAQIESQASQIEVQRAQIEAQGAQIETHRAQVEAQRAQLEALTQNVNDRLSELARELTKELRERNENLLQEQRVTFKQLSLEMSEITTLVDRRRRELETRLGKLEKQS